MTFIVFIITSTLITWWYIRSCIKKCAAECSWKSSRDETFTYLLRELHLASVKGNPNGCGCWHGTNERSGSRDRNHHLAQAIKYAGRLQRPKKRWRKR